MITENIKLYNDDCFNIFKDIKDKVDLFLLDLPYNQTAFKWDEKFDLNKMWKEIKKISHDKTIFIFFCTTKFGYDLIKSNDKWFRYDLIWKKGKITTGFLNSKSQPLRNHEMIYIFYKKRGCYNPQKTYNNENYKRKVSRVYNNTVYGDISRQGFTCTDGSRYPISILDYCKGGKDRYQHPTQKPTDLLEWLIKSYSNENDLVCDFTMGCGSTGVACKNLNRKFIGIEIEKKYFDIAVERLK